MDNRTDVVVVGGGLCGLAAATYLGRGGLKTVVIEKANDLGGRAKTTVEKGFSLNLGAHAVYRKGPAWRVLDELNVERTGGIPSATGSLALANGKVHSLPVGFLSLLTTGLLPLAGKVELAKVLASMDKIDASAVASEPATHWILRHLKTVEARNFLRGFFRVSTYAGDLDRLSAGAAISQLQLVSKHNVLYLNHGWQTLVEGLTTRAKEANVMVRNAGSVASVRKVGEGDSLGNAHWKVELQSGEMLEARAVVLAVGPHSASAMAPGVTALAEAKERATPTKVASLDMALSQLPRPKAKFALGQDEATYVSVHSATAQLAPNGGAVLHAMTYEPSDDSRADEKMLEAAVECLQPGYRQYVVHRRFLPKLVASNDIAAAERGGFKGRPGVAVPGASGLFIAGDWVGAEGMLLDCALSSAEQAAKACIALLNRSNESSAATRGENTLKIARDAAVEMVPH